MWREKADRGGGGGGLLDGDVPCAIRVTVISRRTRNLTILLLNPTRPSHTHTHTHTHTNQCCALSRGQ
jgi:hypothetical protein